MPSLYILIYPYIGPTYPYLTLHDHYISPYDPIQPLYIPIEPLYPLNQPRTCPETCRMLLQSRRAGIAAAPSPRHPSGRDSYFNNKNNRGWGLRYTVVLVQGLGFHMSYSLHSLKGVSIVDCIGDYYKGLLGKMLGV